MLSFILWYLLVALLGWLTFPLAYRLFPALADRGFAMTRALALLVWGYLFWILASLNVIPNNGGGLLLTFLGLAAISGFSLLRPGIPAQMRAWLGARRRMIVTVEVLFLLCFAGMAFVRAGNPEIAGTEKPMEMAFINAILHSPTFPPHDPWLSGFAISYYYFGYVMTAMLAETTGVLGSVAFNLMLALVFALAAVGAYGLMYDLLAAWRLKHPSAAEGATGWPLLGPFFLLIISNLEGFLELLHQQGLFWTFHANGTASSPFWQWLGIQDLNVAPSLPLGGLPQRYYWWWRASRVIQDLSLQGAVTARSEIIDEFPFFSFLLGDLHPHVLAIPFDLLAVMLALNLFLGGWSGETDLFGLRLPISKTGFFASALMVGGLAFLNIWDILFGIAVIGGAFVLRQVWSHGWKWERLGELVAFGLPVGLLAVLFYLPFFLGFSSQAGGILPNLENPTRGVQLWGMFGSLYLPVCVYLIYLVRSEKRPARWKLGLLLAAGATLLLWLFAWVVGGLVLVKDPALAQDYLASQGGLSMSAYFSAATARRLAYSGSWLTLLVLGGTALALLIPIRRQVPSEGEVIREAAPAGGQPALEGLILFLILLAMALTLIPEFVYLRDQFGWRMNTVFKFYYETWLVLSLAAAFGVAVVLQRLKGAWSMVYRAGLALVLVMALTYPVLGLLTKTDDFQGPAFQQALQSARAAKDPSPLSVAARVWSLDGAAFYTRQFPDDMAAAAWLRSAPAGIIVEAVGGGYDDAYNLMSTYSGQPSVLNGYDHEAQWRGGYAEQGTRRDDIQRLYETTSWDVAKAILEEYNVRYITIGTMARQAYRISEAKFQAHLQVVFSSHAVVIYQMPDQTDMLK
jgi:YYY domain-containing protein